MTLYPSSEISNRSPKDIAEGSSALIATNWDTGRRIVVSTNAPIAIYTNPTTRNTYASSNHSGLTANPKHLSNRSLHLHHPSLSESHIKEDSKPENPPPPSHHQPPHLHQMEESKRTKEKERRRTTTLANKGKLKEKSIELSMTLKRNGIEGWKNSPNSKTNHTTMTTKPSTTSTKSHLDFRILMEISDHRRRVMLRFLAMLTILGQTPLFLIQTLDVILTSL